MFHPPAHKAQTAVKGLHDADLAAERTIAWLRGPKGPLILPFKPSIHSDIDTTPKLLDFFREHRYIPVWTGKSQFTVHQSAQDNWLMRAWHDTIHMALQLGMDTESELSVSHWQLSLIPLSMPAVARFVSIDTAGQTMFKEERGYFPEDQAGFTRFVWDKLSGDVGLFDAVTQYKGD